jgi:tetratricopeptide (TPR) repeat protein
VLLRTVHIFNSRSNPTFWAPAIDPAWYDQAALNILQGNWGPFPLFRAPLYPALLAATYGVFGHDLVAARMLNVLFQGIAVWIIYRVGRSYFSAPVGVVAAALFAVNGMAIYFAAEMVSTSAEVLAAAVMMWATLRLTRDTSPVTLILCGLAWGLSVIVRPNFLFMYPVPALVIYLLSKQGPADRWWPQKGDLMRRLLPVVIWGVAAVVPILPVTAANWIKGGEPVLVATQGGINFWIGNNPESTGILSFLPGYGSTWTMEDAQTEAEADVGHPLKQGELSNYYFAKGWHYLLSDPLGSIRFMIRKTLLFFNHIKISNNKHIGYFSALSPWLPPLTQIDFAVLIPLSLLGLWAFWRRMDVKILGAMTALYTVSVVLFFITSRFRLPTTPWLSVLAAAGAVWTVQTILSRPRLKQLVPLSILVPGTVLVLMNPWHMEDANVGWARYMEGNAYLKLNNLDSARVCFLDALKDSTAVARAELNLGVIAGKKGNLAEARSWYEASLDFDSSNADAWNNIGTTRESLGDTSGALEAYRHALTLRPTAPDPRHNLAGTYFRLGVKALKQGDDATAIRQLTSCVELEPASVAYYDLAIAYGRSGATEQALSSLDRALYLDPRYVPAMQLKEMIAKGTATYPKAGGTP